MKIKINEGYLGLLIFICIFIGVLFSFVIFVFGGYGVGGRGSDKVEKNSAVKVENHKKVMLIQAGSSDLLIEAGIHTSDFVESARSFGNIDYKVVEGVGKNVSLVENIIRDEYQKGCRDIFLVGFDYNINLANMFRKFPSVQFYMYGGESVEYNVINYTPRLYEISYLQGVLAGLKTKSGEIGYLANVRSNFLTRSINAFALGVQSVRPSAFVYVGWINGNDHENIQRLSLDLIQNKSIDVIAGNAASCMWCQVAEKEGVYYLSEFIDDSGKFMQSEYYLGSYVYNPKYMYSYFMASISNSQRVKETNLWFGMNRKTFNLVGAKKNRLNQDQLKIINQITKEMINGTFFVFKGTVYSNTGVLVIPSNLVQSDQELQSGLFWLNQNVIEYNQSMELSKISESYDVNLKIYDKDDAEELVKYINNTLLR